LPDPTSAPADDASDDLGAALEANYDALVTADPESKSAPATPDAGATPGAAPVADKPITDTRARGADGKFVQTPKDAKPTDTKVADPKAAPEFKIPDKWPPQVKERLQAIHQVNPEHAQFVLEQYEHFRREAGQYANRMQQEVQGKLKAFDDLLAPGRQTRALQNIDDTTYVRNLIAAGDVLDKNPAQGLRWLAQRYGVDLQKLVNPDAGGHAAIPQEVQQVMQENAQIKAYLQQQHQQAEQQSLRAASDWITQFASQKDPQGQALYPHFDAVIHDIVFAVQNQLARGEQVDVKAAYDKAVRLNDAIWLKDQETARTRTAEAEKARKLRDIEDARKAGFAVSGSGAAPSTDVPDDLGAHLDRNYDKFFS
jgi:hypothetical protein